MEYWYACLIPISVFYLLIGLVTAWKVSRHEIWIAGMFLFASGLTCGLGMAEFPGNLLIGVVMGLLLSVTILPGMRLVRHQREQALARLKGLDVQNDQAFDTALERLGKED